jgi:Tfp pilus assembly protein PilN
MILINLLPTELRPVKRTPLPYIASIAILLLAIGAVGLLFTQTIATKSTLQSEILQRKTELDGLRPIVDEHNQLQDQKLELADKVEIIQEILADRKIWSKHLHKLASLTPENAWYSRMRIVTRRIKESVQEIDPKTQEARTVVKQVPRPILEISGYVINDEEGRSTINPLVDNLNEDEDFTNHFEIITTSLEDTEFNGYDVRGFTLEYLIKTGDQS